MSLLYELGEGASEEALKPGTGALGQLALGAYLCLSRQSHSHTQIAKIKEEEACQLFADSEGL